MVGAKALMFVATAAICLASWSSRATALTLAGACSAAKAKATARAVICAAKERNVELIGSRPAELERCTTRLAKAFGKIEAKGGCSMTGDTAAAQATALQAEDAVLALLSVESEGTDAELACVTSQNRITSRYAFCRARAWAKVFNGDPPPPGMWAAANEPCFAKMGDQFFRSLYRLGCFELTGVPSGPFGPQQAVGPAAMYLAGVNFAGADLFLASLVGATLEEAHFQGAALVSVDMTYANLTGADLSDANLGASDLGSADASGADLSDVSLADAELVDVNLTGADLTNVYFGSSNLTGANLDGAILDGVDWSDTAICPDGTVSGDNGDTCCGHHVGNPPASCTP